MPRNSGGTYSLPAGNPVVTGTTIASVWANTTMSDIATALTGSLARNGDGGMTGPFLASSGTIGAPGISWSSETTSGWYRAGAGDFRHAIAGVDVYSIGSYGLAARALVPTAATVPSNGLYLPSANTVGLATNSLARGSINSTGNWVLNNPSSGTTLSITSAAATTDALKFINGATRTWIMGPGTATAADDFALLYDSTRGATVMRATNTGNVSIVAPSSGVGLTVNGNGAANINLATGAGVSPIFSLSQAGQTSWSIYNPVSSNDFRIYNGSSDRVTLTTAGNFTIAAPSSGVALTVSGTCAVLNSLSITGTSNAAEAVAALSTAGSSSVSLGNTADGIPDGLTIGYVGSTGGFSPAKGYIHYSGTSLTWYNTGYTQTMSLDSSGNLVCVGNVTAFSDVRLKDDIETIRGALDLVHGLRGITYARKDNGARGTGLIAQDVQAVLPEAVMSDENGMLSVAYGNVAGLLVEAIKELNDKLDRAGIH